MSKNKFYKINVWFLICAFSILIALILVLVFSIRFLSSTLIHSFSTDPSSSGTLNFEIERAQKIQP